MWPLKSRFFATLTILINHRFDLCTPNASGHTVLHTTILHCPLAFPKIFEIVREAIPKLSFDPMLEQTDSKQQNLLHLAVQSRAHTTMKLVVDQIPKKALSKLVTQQNDRHMRPIDVAVSMSSGSILYELYRAGTPIEMTHIETAVKAKQSITAQWLVLLGTFSSKQIRDDQIKSEVVGELIRLRHYLPKVGGNETKLDTIRTILSAESITEKRELIDCFISSLAPSACAVS